MIPLRHTVLFLAALPALFANGPAPEPERVIARMGAREIRARDIPRILDELHGLDRPRVADEATLAAVVRRYVTDEVVLENMRRAGRPPVPAANRREAILAFVNDEIERRLRANPPDVEKYYRDHLKAFTDPNQARVRMIRAATRDEAQRAIERLNEGGDFLQIAGAKAPAAAEPVASVIVDDWGYVASVGSFPAATAAIFRLAPGGFTAEPIERGGTWYVFRLDAIIPAKNKPFAEIRHKVTESCYDARRKELKPVVVQAMLDAARVEFFLQPGFTGPPPGN